MTDPADGLSQDPLLQALRCEIKRHVLDSMPTDASGELSAISWDDCLAVYGAWRARFVTAVPRRVYRSAELLASQAVQDFVRELAELERKIAEGEPLDAHLSTGVQRAYTPRGSKRRGGRRDLDRLLAEWGVHHLHLSSQIGQDGKFVERGRDVLFAVFKPDAAYLIGVFPHGRGVPPHRVWAQAEVLKIIARNWPDAGILRRSLTAIGLEGGGASSDEARYALRQGGSTSLVEIDGRVYLPRGQSLAGTPIDVRMHVNAVVHDFWGIEREGTLAELLKRGGFSAEARQRLQPLVHEDRFGFFDPVRGHFCSFDSLLGNW